MHGKLLLLHRSVMHLVHLAARHKWAEGQWPQEAVRVMESILRRHSALEPCERHEVMNDPYRRGWARICVGMKLYASTLAK
eukprot:1056913-Alexandrium_andersonii.AAC.1